MIKLTQQVNGFPVWVSITRVVMFAATDNGCTLTLDCGATVAVTEKMDEINKLGNEFLRAMQQAQGGPRIARPM